MLNRMLLTTLESIIVVIIGIIILVFVYILYNNVLKQLFTDFKSKRISKLSKSDSKALEDGESFKAEEEKAKAPKEAKKTGKDVYNSILDKIHQNRELYYKDEEQKTVFEPVKSETKSKKDDNRTLDELDFSKLGLFEDFDFDSKDDSLDDFDLDFGDDDEGEGNLAQSFKSAVKRKRMIKRNISIGQEINQCSDRIKTILLLDVINKRPL